MSIASIIEPAMMLAIFTAASPRAPQPEHHRCKALFHTRLMMNPPISLHFRFCSLSDGRDGPHTGRQPGHAPRIDDDSRSDDPGVFGALPRLCRVVLPDETGDIPGASVKHVLPPRHGREHVALGAVRRRRRLLCQGDRARSGCRGVDRQTPSFACSACPSFSWWHSSCRCLRLFSISSSGRSGGFHKPPDGRPAHRHIRRRDPRDGVSRRLEPQPRLPISALASSRSFWGSWPSSSSWDMEKPIS